MKQRVARTTPSIFGFSGIIQAEPGIPGGKPETRENPGFPGILGRYECSRKSIIATQGKWRNVAT